MGSRLEGFRPPTPDQVEEHHRLRKQGGDGLLTIHPPTPTLRPIPDLPEVSADEYVMNRRSTDYLRQNDVDGEHSRWTALDVMDRGPAGVARARDLIGQLREHDPKRADSYATALLSHLPDAQHQRAFLGGDPPTPRPLGILAAEAPERQADSSPEKTTPTPTPAPEGERPGDSPKTAEQPAPISDKDPQQVVFLSDEAESLLLLGGAGLLAGGAIAQQTAKGGKDGGSSPTQPPKGTGVETYPANGEIRQTPPSQPTSPKGPDIESIPKSAPNGTEVLEATDLKQPIDHDKGEEPHPITEDWVGKMNDQKVAGTMKETMMGSGQTTAVEKGHTEIKSSGGYDAAEKEFEKIRQASGVGQENVLDQGNGIKEFKLPDGTTVKVRPISKKDGPTLEVRIPDGAGNFHDILSFHGYPKNAGRCPAPARDSSLDPFLNKINGIKGTSPFAGTGRARILPRDAFSGSHGDGVYQKALSRLNEVIMLGLRRLGDDEFKTDWLPLWTRLIDPTENWGLPEASPFRNPDWKVIALPYSMNNPRISKVLIDPAAENDEDRFDVDTGEPYDYIYEWQEEYGYVIKYIYRLDLNQMFLTLLDLGIKEFIVTDNCFSALNQSQWILGPCEDDFYTVLYAPRNPITSTIPTFFSREGNWALISYYEYHSLLGGTPEFIDAYLRHAGGLEAVKRRFYALDIECSGIDHWLNLKHNEVEKFYAMLGWERPRIPTPPSLQK